METIQFSTMENLVGPFDYTAILRRERVEDYRKRHSKTNGSMWGETGKKIGFWGFGKYI